MKGGAESPRPFRSRIVAVLGFAGLSLAGCLPPVIVPLIPAVDLYAPDPHMVKEAATRADILMAFGCPDSRQRDDRYLVYGWFQVHAFGLFFSSGPAVWDSHRLILRFAPDGRLLEHSELSAFTATRADKKVQKWIEAADQDRS